MKAVITGATKGIGYAIAQAFAAGGFDLALTARSEEDLLAVQQDFQGYFPDIRVVVFPADLSCKEAAKGLAQRVMDVFGGIDVLVNNAGLFLESDITEEEDSLLEDMMAVNLFAPYYLTKELLPAIKEQGRGHLFYICSVASREAAAGKGAYSVTKFALLGLAKALRCELMESGVRVTAVLPGATQTASWNGLEPDPGHIMQPEDVAMAVWNAWRMSPSAVVEEIIIRPQLEGL